jgi:hypothetical protein
MFALQASSAGRLGLLAVVPETGRVTERLQVREIDDGVHGRNGGLLLLLPCCFPHFAQRNS